MKKIKKTKNKKEDYFQDYLQDYLQREHTDELNKDNKNSLQLLEGNEHNMNYKINKENVDSVQIIDDTEHFNNVEEKEKEKNKGSYFMKNYNVSKKLNNETLKEDDNIYNIHLEDHNKIEDIYNQISYNEYEPNNLKPSRIRPKLIRTNSLPATLSSSFLTGTQSNSLINQNDHKDFFSSSYSSSNDITSDILTAPSCNLESDEESDEESEEFHDITSSNFLSDTSVDMSQDISPDMPHPIPPRVCKNSTLGIQVKKEKNKSEERDGRKGKRKGKKKESLSNNKKNNNSKEQIKKKGYNNKMKNKSLKDKPYVDDDNVPRPFTVFNKFVYKNFPDIYNCLQTWNKQDTDIKTNKLSKENVYVKTIKYLELQMKYSIYIMNKKAFLNYLYIYFKFLVEYLDISRIHQTFLYFIHTTLNHCQKYFSNFDIYFQNIQSPYWSDTNSLLTMNVHFFFIVLFAYYNFLVPLYILLCRKETKKIYYSFLKFIKEMQNAIFYIQKIFHNHFHELCL